MKIANYTLFYRDMRASGIEYAVKHSALLGFDAVEFLGLSDDDLSVCLNPNEAVKLLSDYNLTVACYSIGENLLNGDVAEKQEHMDRNIELAAKLGSPCFHHTLYNDLSLSSNSPEFEDVLECVLPLAKHIASRCSEYGIACLYEPQGMYFNGIDGLGRLLSVMKSEYNNIGVCGDSGNSYFVDVEPEKVFRRFADDIRHVHIKDYRYTDFFIPADECYVSHGGKHITAVPMGEGDINIPVLFDILHSVNYNGAVSLEFEGTDAELKTAIQAVRELSKA